MKNYFFALLTTLMVSTGLTAGTIRSAAGGAWTTGSTWEGGVAPTATDIVIIDVGDIVTTASAITCAGLTIDGQITLGTGTTLTINGNVSGSGTISGGKPFAVTGDWTFAGTATNGSTVLTLNGSGDQTVSGVLSTSTADLTINKPSGTVRLGSAFYVGGAFTLTAGTFDAATYLLTVGSATLTAGTLKAGAASWASNYSFTAAPSANVTIEYYGASPTINTGTYYNLIFSGMGTASSNGLLTVQGDLLATNGGSFDFGSNPVTIAGTRATQTINPFTTSGLVSMTKTAGTATFTGNVTTGGLTLAGSGGTLDCGPAFTHTVTGGLTLTAGTIALNSCTMTVNGALALTSGIPNFGTSTLILGGTTQTIVPTTYYNLTLAGSGTKTMSGVTTIGGTLTINSGVTFATGNKALTLNGDVINNGGTISAGSSVVTLGGSNSQSIAGFTTTNDLICAKTGGTATFTSNITADLISYTGNDATIALADGVTMTIPTSITIARPTLATNTLAVGNGTLTTASIALGGTLVGTLNTVLSIAGGSVTTTAGITSAGPASMLTFTGAGTLTTGTTFMSGAQGTFTPGQGTVIFNRGGVQTVAPYAYTFNNVTLAGSAAKTVTNATINGTLSIEGTATVSGTPTYGPAAALRYNVAVGRAPGVEWVSPFTGTGGVIIDNVGAITLGAAKVMGSGAPLTIDAGATLATANYQVTLGGNFVNNGTFTAGSSPIEIGGTAGTQSINGFTTTGAVLLTKTAGTATFTGNVSAGDLTLNGTGGTLSLGAGLTHTFTGTLTRTAGTLDVASSTLNIDGATSGTGGSWTAGTGTVNFRGAGAQTIPGVSYYDLSFSGAGTKTIAAGTTVTVGRNWSVESPVTMTTTANAVVTGNITGSGAITMGTGTITLAGNWTNNGTFTPGTGTVAYNGATAQSVAALTYYKLTTSGAGLKTLAGATTVNNLFTNSAVINAAANTFSLPGTKNNAGGTVRFSGASNGVALSTGTVEYYGTSQTITAGTYANLTINQASGSATLGGNATVTGVLTFTNGRIVTGASTLSLGTTASVSGADAAKYVQGNLLKAFGTGNSSFTYTVGDASVYAPVDVALASVTVGGNLTVKTTAGDHSSIAGSGINPSRNVNRYWTLTNGGITFGSYSAAFNFTAGDVDGGAATASFVVRKYAASAWTPTTAGTRTATSTQATGLTSFGDFSIGNQLIDHYAVSAASPQTAGAAFAATVTAQDLLNQTVVDNNTTVVTMTSTGNGTFDSNGDGTFGDNTKTLTAGTFSIQTKDNTAQSINLTATDGNAKTGTMTGVVVNPAGPSALLSTIAAAPTSLTANGVTTSALTVQLKDQFGNNLITSGGTVALSVTSGSIGAVTDNANGTYSAVLTSPTVTGGGTISGTINGSAMTSTVAMTYVPGPASVAQSTITASPVSLTADGTSTSTISIQLKDAFGNNLVASAGTVALSTTAGSVGSATDNLNGTYTATLTAPTLVGSATVTGTLNASPIVDDATVTFTPGAASAARSTITASPVTITANGVATSTITVQLKDEHDNLLVASGGTIALSTTAGTLGSVTDHNDGTYTATLTSPTLVGSATITGTLNGGAITSTASVTFVPGGASLATSTVSVSPASITANGVTTSTITVQLKDAFGNNLTASGGTVALSASAGTLGAVTDNTNGTYSAVLTSPTLAGSAVITGTLNGAGLAQSASVAFTPGEPTTAQSVISVSAASITADGIATSTVTVQLKDAFGNNVPASGGTVALSTTGGTLGLVTDNGNGTYTAVLTSPTVVGSATVSGTLQGTPITSTASVTFVPGAGSVATSTISASSSSITANGVTTSTITVQMKDAFGNNLVAGPGTVVLSTTAGTLSAVTNNNNGTYTAVLTSPTLAGSAIISGTLDSAPIVSTATVTFVPGPATTAQSVISASPASITADGVTTSTVTVQLKDAFGNNLLASGGTVALSATSGTLGSVTDNSNGTYTAVLTSATTAGTSTISGILDGSAIASTASVTYTAGPVSVAQSTITANPTAITANGSNQSTITVQLKDEFGNNLTASAGTVALVATSGEISAVTDHGNGTYTAVLTAPTFAGSAMIFGTLNGVSMAAAPTVDFTAGAPSLTQSTITASHPAITANGVTTSTITVQLKDALDNDLAISGGTVALSTTAGTLGAVTDNSNGSYTAVLTSPTAVSVATVTGTLNGSPLVASASVEFVPGPATTAQTQISAAPPSITANGVTTSTVTVQLKDAFGNNLTASGGAVVLSATAGTLGAVTDNANGTYTAVLTSATAAGTSTVTGTLDGSAIADNAAVAFIPGAPSLAQSVVSVSSGSITANGATTSTVTVQLKDAQGNNLTASGGTVVVAATAGTVGAVTDNTNGTYTAVLTSPTLVGSATVSATLDGNAIASTAAVVFVPGAASVAQSTITAEPASITADGVTTATLTVQLKDAFGNNIPSSSGTVVLNTTGGSLGAVTDNLNGTYAAVLTSPAVVGSATVTGALDGVAITDTEVVAFTPGAPSLATSTLSVSQASITADGVTTSTVTVQLKDAFGNNLVASGGTVALAATSGTLGAVTDNANGTYTAVLTSSTTAGSATVSGTLDGSAIVSNASVTYVPGAASAAQSTISVSPASITANGVTTSTVTVQMKDAFGNNVPASGGTVALSATSGTIGGVTDSTNGTYTAVLTSSTTAGTATVTGTLNGTAITSTASVAFTAGAASAAQTTITASPSSITADGVTTSTVTVQLKDAFGNNLTSSGGTVMLSTTGGTLGTVTDNANGTLTAVLTSPSVTGSATLSGTLDGAAIADNEVVAFTVGAASLATSTISVAPGSITADGVTTSTVTVQLKDANNNNLTASGGTVALTTTTGTLSAVTDNTNGTYTAVLTSPTTAGRALIAGTIDGGAIASTDSVIFVPGAPSLAQSVISSSPTSITADGVATSTVTVQLKDAFGNNVPASGGAVALAATSGTVGTVTDNNNGTYTAVLTSSTVLGTSTVSGTLNDSAFASTASVGFVPGAANVAASTISVSPASITADGAAASTVTVQLKDALGHNLGASGGTVVLTSTKGTLGSVTDHNDGTYTAALTSSTMVDTAQITAALNGTPLAANASVVFTVGTVSAAHSVITINQPSLTADGTSTATVTVRLKDAFGNALVSSGGTVVLSAEQGTLGSVTDNHDGTYTAVLTSPTTAGSTTISGMLEDSTIASTVGVNFVPGPVDLARTAITATPASITADGASTTTIWVQLMDANDNLLEAGSGTVVLAATAGVLSAVTDHNNGTYSATLTSTATTGSSTVSGTLDGAAIASTVAVAFVPGAPSLAHSTVSVSAASLTADGVSTSTVTVQLKDANSNNLAASAGTVSLLTTLGTLGSVTDNGNGTYSAVLTAGTVADTARITARLNGSLLTANAIVSIEPGALNLEHSTITPAPASITADGSSTSTITVRLKDVHDNNRRTSSGTVTLFTTSGALSSVTDHANGTYTALLTSAPTVGSAEVMARLNSTMLPSSATVNFTVGAASPARSVLALSVPTMPADGSGTATVTVTLKDAFNRTLTTSGGTVALSTTSGTLSAVTDNGNGTYSAVLTAPLTAGTATVSGRVNDSVMTSTASITFTPLTITITGNAGTPGAVLGWVADSARTVIADTAGNYSITVPYRWSGTVTPALAGFTFDPASTVYTDVTAEQTGRNFAATGVLFTITGNAGTPGAVLSWTDDSVKTVAADSTGAYAFTVSYNWSGTVRPSRTGYVFTPDSIAYANVLAAQTAQDYAATPFVHANVKVILAGAYTAGSMRTALAAKGLLPKTSDSAYAAATFAYSAKVVDSIPASSIVDWVLVELRTGTAGSTKAAAQAAFLKSDGQIVDTNGVDPVLFMNVAAGDYYVVVRHRNHHPVMSAAPVAVSAEGVLYDFTTDVAKAYGTEPMMALTGGGFGMWAGDINRNGNVRFTGSQNDRNLIMSTVGFSDLTNIVSGYLPADLNLDGFVKFTGSSNDNNVLLQTVSFADPLRIVPSQVPN